MSKRPRQPPRHRRRPAKADAAGRRSRRKSSSSTARSGSAGTRGAPLREPEAEGNLDFKPPPEWLTPAQRDFWCETLLDAPRDLLKRIDWAMFAEYVQTWDRYVTAVLAQRKLDADAPLPFLVKGSNGPVTSPYLRQMNHCIVLLTRLQVEMGFTPVARTRFGAIDAGPGRRGRRHRLGYLPQAPRDRWREDMSEAQPTPPIRLMTVNDPETGATTLAHLTRAMGLVIGTTPEAHRYFTAALKVASVAAESGERAQQVQSKIEQIMRQLTSYSAAVR